MCVSQKACRENLPVLLELLFSKASDSIKTIIVISLGDLTRRFPNELQSYQDKMFNLLDDSKDVRNTGLFIFSQLIMGNIILLKDQVADIYVLIEDQDPRTSQLAQNLVNELERNPYVKEAKPD